MMIIKGQRVIGIIVLILIFSYSHIHAQVCSGGKPIFGIEISDQLVSKVKEHHYIPSKAQLKSSELPNKGQAFTFAHQFTVNYTPDNAGYWTVLEDGSRVWRLLISSHGAYSINLIFDRYKLPRGGKVFIYNTDYTDVLGSFTDANNKPNGVLATAPVIGDEIIVEYQEPKNAAFKAELLIGAVNHDYVGIHEWTLKSGIFGDAGYCNQDISCYDPNNELDIRRSVVKLIVDGRELCTGTMINNTVDNTTPYMITAAHCLRLDAAGSTTIAFFNYESPHCAVIEGSKADTIGTESRAITGGITRVLVDSLDIALVEMSEVPPAHYRPYYAGWTLNAAPPKPFVAIHHANGDVKKISTFDGDIIATTFKEEINKPYAQVENFHWRVSEWTTGTTEVGSSGCPLFDGNNLLVGTLSGGQAFCGEGKSINDYFMQFYKAWDKNDKLNEHFQPWLDPSGTAQSLEGVDPYLDREFKRLSNVETGDSPLTTRIDEGGYLSGHNANNNSMYADKYAGIKTATIKGVYMMPSKYKYGSAQTVNLMVWEGSEMPEALLIKKEGIQIKDLKVKKEIFLEFDSPVDVSGTFFVGYEINYDGSPVDTLAVYHSSSSSKINNSMLVYSKADGWNLASEENDKSKNYTLWLDVLAESVIYGDTQVVPEVDKYVDVFPIPSKGDFVYINSNGQVIKNIKIYDVNGRVVGEQIFNVRGDKLPVKIEGLARGIYILKILIEDKKIIKKLVVN